MLPLERKVSLAETLSRFVYQPGPNDSLKRNSNKSCKEGSAEAVTSTITPTSLINDEDIANRSSEPTNEVRQVSFGGSRAHAKRRSEEGLDNPSKKRLGKPARSSRPVDHADLSVLTDRLKEGLDVVFCGFNPGIESALKGLHYADGTNRFWGALEKSGFTEQRCTPEQGALIVQQYNLGLTDLVSRPSRQATDVSIQEQYLGVPVVLEKIRKFKPKLVCIVGMGVCRAFDKVVLDAWKPEELVREPVDFRHVEDLPIIDTRKPRKPGNQSTKNNNDKYGIDLSQPRPYKVIHPGAAENGTDAVTLFWVVPGTSGLVAAYPPAILWRYFARARHMLELIKRNKVDYNLFREIDQHAVLQRVARLTAS